MGCGNIPPIFRIICGICHAKTSRGASVCSLGFTYWRASPFTFGLGGRPFAPPHENGTESLFVEANKMVGILILVENGKTVVWNLVGRLTDAFNVLIISKFEGSKTFGNSFFVLRTS